MLFSRLKAALRNVFKKEEPAVRQVQVPASAPIRARFKFTSGVFLRSKTYQRELRMGRMAAWRRRRLLAQSPF